MSKPQASLLYHPDDAADADAITYVDADDNTHADAADGDDADDADYADDADDAAGADIKCKTWRLQMQ